MRWLRRGILIRLAIYVPLISFLAWRASGGCEPSPPPKADDGLDQQLAPHRKVITLPDGTQQEIVELTAEEAEAILGHPIPRDLNAEAKAERKAGEAKAGAVDAKAGDADAKAGDADAKAGDAAKAGDVDAKAGDVDAKAGDAKLGEAESKPGEVADAKPAQADAKPAD